MRKIVAIAAALAAAAVPAQSAWAWGSQGHQYVGSVAERMLEKNAFERTKQALADSGGYDVNFGVAAVWADCVRDVRKLADGSFKWILGDQTPKACTNFNTKAGRARMEDYARRNWVNCENDGEPCLSSYHYVNLAIQRDGYALGIAGTSDHDVVHAINAAIAKLEGKPVPAPFDIKDDTEAFLLLAHFVGDIHQPLHVGSVYLRENGWRADPDTSAPGTLKTRGGNYLTFGADNQMHGDWDGIPGSWGVAPPETVVISALKLPVMDSQIDTWSTAWASQSLGEAKLAFKGVSFGNSYLDGVKRKWPAQFDNRQDYTVAKGRTQRVQLMRASARLAQVLNRVWA